MESPLCLTSSPISRNIALNCLVLICADSGNPAGDALRTLWISRAVLSTSNAFLLVGPVNP